MVPEKIFKQCIFAILQISPLVKDVAFYLNKFRMLCAKFVFKKWPRGTGKEEFLMLSMYFCYFPIISPWLRMFFYVCLSGVFRPTQEFFTHLEMSPLPLNGCKFWPMLSTYGHWAVRVLKRATSTVRGHLFIMVISEDPWHPHLMPSVLQWSCHCFSDLGLSQLGFEHPTFRLRVNDLTHCATATAIKDVALHWPNLIHFTVGCFLPSLVEIGFLRRR